MKIVAFLMVLSISGCSIFSQPVPIKQKFPDATPELMKKCEDLKKVEGDKVAITEMLKIIVHNYQLYYQCSTKVEGWQDWYNTQKQIFDQIK